MWGTGSRERKGTEERQATLALECQSQSWGKVSEGQTQGVRDVIGKRSVMVVGERGVCVCMCVQQNRRSLCIHTHTQL